MEDLNGDRCPGEFDCPLLKPKGCSPESVCPDCPKLPTKAGQTSEAVQLALGWAMKIDERIKAGIPLSSTPSPTKISALHGLQRGRARFEEWLDKKSRDDKDKAGME